MTSPLIVKGLRKSYGKFEALKGVSFSVHKGEIFGLLGPNGAGKSTLTSILAGVLTADRGTVKILGKHPEDAKYEMNIATAYQYLSSILRVEQNLKVYAGLYNIQNVKKRVKEVIELFELESVAKKLTSTLSSGQITRLNLAKGFINNPKVLLLDECTVGLDPEIAVKVRRVIKEAQKKYGTTILFTSHNMAEVEELCDRICFLDRGKVHTIGTSKELKKKITIHEMVINFTGQSPLKELQKQNVTIKKATNRCIVITYDTKKVKIHNIIHSLFKKGFVIKDLDIHKPSLEDVFLLLAEAAKK